MSRAEGVLLCGGGTGGHVFPGLAVAAACRRRGESRLRWIGDPQRLEATLVPQAGIPLLPCGLSRPRLTDPRWLCSALRRTVACARELLRRPPAVVVSLGGYAALLPGLLAPWFRRPLVVLESNAWPGRTNRLLARRARAVVTHFPEAGRALPRARLHQLGNPVRSFTRRERGQGSELRLLVMGGSLAARSLNDLLVAAAPDLAAIPGLRLIHLAGESDAARMQEAYAAAGLQAEVLGFCHDMAGLYDRADLALSRAGATTVAECCAAGLGALYMPLPWAAEDHQTANARAVARVGGAVLLPQDRLRPAGLVRLLHRLATDREAVARLGRRAAILARPQAADDVAQLVLTTSRAGSRDP